MKTLAAFFPTQLDAEPIIQKLHRLGFRDEQIVLLTPSSYQEEKHDQNIEEEDSKGGSGTALGALTGGAAGLTGGLATFAVTSLFLPGVGPLLGVGLGLAALFGVSGAALGGAAGYAFGRAFTEHTPHNELFVYEYVLRNGGSVLLVSFQNETEAAKVRELFADADLHTVDAAREQWWLGMRALEEAAYPEAHGKKAFQEIEQTYRTGFEAALDARIRGKSYEEARPPAKRTLFLNVC